MSVTYSKRPGSKTTAEEAINGADLTGKVIIVTGGNSGLGLETVRVFSNAGAKVYLCCRNISSGEKAKESVKDSLKGEVVVAQMDTTDFDIINNFTKMFLSNESRLDYLVLNAGVMACPLERTKYGFEMQIGTNYIGHYVLTQNLLQLMKKQDFQSRIVIVSSVGHKFGDVDLSDINYQRRKYGAWQAYGQAKTALILWGRYLAKELKDTNVLVFSLHPGGIKTNLQRHVTTSQWLNYAFDGFSNLMLALGVFKTIPQGTSTQVYACVAKDLEGHSGEYLNNCQIEKTNAYADDMEKAQKLVQLTKELLAKVDKEGSIN